MPIEEILRLSSERKGSRRIASELGIKHQASVFKVLKKAGMCQDDLNQHIPSDFSIVFTRDSNRFRFACEWFAKYLMCLGGYSILECDSGNPYDFVVHKDNQYSRIQVKSSTAKTSSGNYIFTLEKQRWKNKRRYKAGDFDHYLLIDIKLNAWLIPLPNLISSGKCTPAIRFPGCKIH